MGVLQKKVCMLGAFSVGKTSLVSQYVNSIFSEKYTTTIGVKIDKKQLDVGSESLSLVLWDVYGEDNHQRVMPSYLRGLAGYILVVDPTRPSTINTALTLHEMVQDSMGEKPFVLAKNKSDLKDEWDVEALESLLSLEDISVAAIETSAKTDTGVDDLFLSLAQSLLPTPSGK